ncbi:MAG: hypothetical protein M1812_003641 [Candelaria pacifica]|nr:MAG: hypothetical protein M1812_003641 [Candelaria pacifica]
MSAGSSFLQFWLNDSTRDTFLSQVLRDDLPAVRLACHDFSVRAAPFLFQELTITFRTSSFTRPARMAAIERIGRHVRRVTFNAPHTPETFLPPLLDPVTGEERAFIYSPRVNLLGTPGVKARIPKYGSWEVTDLLIKQYSPLFHAATDIPSFVRAFSAMPLLTQITISCPGQDPSQKYRRSVVDYALISLRIAIESAPLTDLTTLSLSPIHPAGVLYLRPVPGYGMLPNSVRRWTQIRSLVVQMDNYSSSYNSQTDHLKLLRSYLQTFSCKLTDLSFRWNGMKGPCPLSLDSEPCIVDRSPSASQMSVQSMKFVGLRYMQIENALMDASQISALIVRHRRTIREFEFEDIALRTGGWDEALAPLTKISGSEKWKNQQLEVMDVPLVLRHAGPEPTTVVRKEIVLEPDQRKRIWTKMRSKTGLEKGSSPSSRLEKVGSRGRDLLRGTPDHVKKLLRSSVLNWI